MEFTPMTPETTFQYADLNIKHINPENTLAMVKRAIRMGYDTVAINVDLGDIADYYTELDMLWTPGNKSSADGEPPKKKKKKNQRKDEMADGIAGILKKKLIPPPHFVDVSHLDLSDLEKRGKVFRQFSRITFTANEQVVINKVFIHPTVLSYDIVAVRPGDPSVIDTLSRKTELFDIITIDHLEENRGKWLSGSKVMDRIRNDGVFYEIAYAESLMPATRKNALFNGRVLIRSLKSKNVIICSGAETMLDLRSPVDVMNMSLLWGVANNEARKMISGFPKNLLLQAECRGTGNGDVCSMKLSEAEKMAGNNEEEEKEDVGNDEGEEEKKETVKAPPIDVRMNVSQYKALLQATKNANDMMKKIKASKAATASSSSS
ncbi:Protein CBG19874 [Caenorhabditis briggsae]|nr:Protein CBG19874 [Caenorhabditis briggsae]CAP37044.2 Protein CBG19874 [Caenorhabditis briggsae]